MKRSARQTRRGHRARRHAEAVNMPAECEAVRSLPPAALQAVLDLCLEYEHLGNPSLCVYCDAILGKATLLDAS